MRLHLSVETGDAFTGLSDTPRHHISRVAAGRAMPRTGPIHHDAVHASSERLERLEEAAPRVLRSRRRVWKTMPEVPRFV
jgi:hypothetical protein